MSGSREEILADFQACTGIEDVGVALGHLEESKWDLLVAVNRVMPQESQTIASVQSADIEMIEDITPRSASSMINGGVDLGVHVSLSPDFVQTPSTSFGKNSARLLHFHISYGDQVIQLQISDSSSVGDLKLSIYSKTNVPACQQILTGWKKEPSSDSCTLSSLELPRENLLFLNGLDHDKIASEAMIGELLAKKYSLVVETQNKNYNLTFEGSKSIGDVKAAVYDLTDIPVRNQVWTGWPAGVDDTSVLAQAGLTQPDHRLSVRQKKEYKRIIVDLGNDSDSSVEEFEDASESFTGEDEIFIEEVSKKKIQPLIPDNIEDETAGVLHFNDGFSNRFGVTHPEFFPGTLEEAIKEACLKPAKERKLLAVYLHHDNSVLSNVFCTELLCFESVLQFLHSHFVVWGWDLTFESNKVKFLSSVGRNLGSMAAVTVRNIDVERLPALIIIMRMRSNTEIFTVVNGNIGVNELLTSLIQAVDVFTEQQRQEVKEEEERTVREMIKIEQDQAYQASLEIDRAKEEAKQQQILFETQEKKRIENERLEAEAKKEAERQLLESRLPDEPGETSPGITKIRFRLPMGDCLERRFLVTNKLQVLLDYLVVKGYHINEYKVISSWPRRDLTTLDVQSTLQELNLCPQETLTLEER